MSNVDVVVIGAGPAGVSAAITLARAQRSVVLIDKATFPRDKICGDGLTASALRQMEELGLDPGGIVSWLPVGDMTLRSPWGREFDFPLPRDRGSYAAVATRFDLDAALVELAIKEGVDVRQGNAVVAVKHTNEGVRVSAAGLDPFNARFAVAADGMWSPTRKLLGATIPGYRGEWHAFRQYFADVGARASRELYVSFERDILPGYFWSFPLPDGRANVGFGIKRGGKHSIQDMKALWADLLERPHIRLVLGDQATPLDTHRAWPIPARIDDIEASSRRVLFVGDAVAACDTMTGEGIGQALETGRMAVETMLAGWDDPDQVGANYRAALDRAMVADHKMSAALVRALQHRKGAETAIRVAGMSRWTRRNFGRWLFEDYPRALVLTPRRWRRGALHQPGAFR